MTMSLSTKRLLMVGIAFLVGTFQTNFAQSNRVILDLMLHIHGSDTGSRVGIFFSPLGDINGDGYDDIALARLASFSPKEVMVYYGGITPDTIKDMTLRFGDIDGNRDFDGDGINDISIVTYDSTWLIYKGFGDSIGTVPADSISVPEREAKFKFIEGGYVNPDSYADYLISSWSVEIDSNRIRYFESPFVNRVSSWQYVERIGQHDLRSFGFIDYNCDSIQDIYLGLLAGVDSVGSVKIFYGPTFSSTPDVIIEAPVGFDSVNVRRFVESCSNIGDVDGDGCDDLYVQFEFTPLIYRGSLTPDTLFDYQLELSSAHANRLGDVNGDGDNDFLVRNSGRSASGSVDLYLGGVEFDIFVDVYVVKGDLPPTLQDFIGWRLEQAGDMNGDGFDDIMFASQNFAGGEPGDVWIMKGGVDIVTDVEDDDDIVLPESFQLNQNYPNPFNPETTIEFSLTRREYVSLNIYNILGQQVRELVNESLGAGHFRISWDGTDDARNSVASGIYYYQLKTDNSIQAKKMLLLK